MATLAKRTTAPAFQFYPKDFLTSPKVRRMSMTERGVYITLLCLCWLDGSLTADLAELADECHVPLRQFQRMWDRGQLRACFIEKAGRLSNDRLDIERRKQAEYRRRQSDNGKHGGRPKKDEDLKPVGSFGLSDIEAKKSSPISDLRSTSASTTKNKKNVSPEPLRDSTPALLTFVTVGNGPKSWDLTERQAASWRSAYPALDIVGECRKASVWVEAQPERRKTASGMARFLVNWFNRSVWSRPRALAATGTEGRGRTGVVRGQFDGVEEED